MRDLPLREYRPVPALRASAHEVRRASTSAVDVHNHLGRWLGPDGSWAAPDVGALLALMDEVNVEAIVDLDGRWGEELEANLDRYDRAHPGRFATFCHLDWDEAATEGFTERLVASLYRSVAAGARGIKIWKDLGLHVRDAHGELLMPDDARLHDVWAAAGELGLPVLIHVADPIAFFEPMNAENERLEELLANPDWSFADTERFPRFWTIMSCLEAVVASHPGTTFVGAHFGCCAEDLAWVGRMLDSYPNFNVDIAARIAELGRQPRAARDLIVRHPSRVLFGTDEFPPDADTYAIHFRFLETADEHFAYSTEDTPPQGRWAISGLDLPAEVLQQIYSANARRLVAGL